MNNHAFASRLREAMRAKAISASDLARQVSVTPTAVYNWEQGNTIPRANTLSAVAKVLSVTAAYLLTGKEPDASPGKALDEIIAQAEDQIAAAIGVSSERVKVKFEVTSVVRKRGPD